MTVENVEIEGLKLIRPDVHTDLRGYFTESWNARRYRDAGIDADFVQDNESTSMKGVVRGLHWQTGKFAQAKLVRVVRGAVLDIAVDIRKGSPTFGRHHSVLLSGENKMQFYMPRGFAHGFAVLEDDTVFCYKCDNFFDSESERGMDITDPELGIKLPELGCDPIFSEKDRRHPGLKGIEPYGG